MAINYDTSAYDDFQDPIPVDLKFLGIENCGKFRDALHRYNEKRPEAKKLDYGGFVATILAKQWPAFIRQEEKEEKAERGGGVRRKNARSGGDQGVSPKVHRPFGTAPQAAE